MADGTSLTVASSNQESENQQQEQKWQSPASRSARGHQPKQIAHSIPGEQDVSTSRALDDEDGTGQIHDIADAPRQLEEETSTAVRWSSTRKERPSRRRSVLDAIAVEKNLVGSDTTHGTKKESLDHAGQSEDPSWKRRTRRERESYRFGESRYPLLQTTVDELAVEEERAEESSNNEGQKSPDIQPLRTSFESSDGMLSPESISSPIQIPSIPEPGSISILRPPLHLRMKTQYGDLNGSSNSARRMSRGTSARSGSSSWSPASAFLSQWSRDESTQPANPDNEGQELGDNGEYVIGKQIGYGGFSVVKEIHTFEHGDRVVRAVKIVRKQVTGHSEQENEKAQNQFEHEVSMWRYLKHAYILPLLAVYDTPFATFCITQLSTGGTLFDLVSRHRRQASRSSSTRSFSARSRNNSSLSQVSNASSTRKFIPLAVVKRYIYQLASAIRYLHQDVRVVHRDIKLENCLVSITTRALTSSVTSMISRIENVEMRPTEENPGNILLCDFGMSDFVASDDRGPEEEEEEEEEDGPDKWSMHGGSPRDSGTTTHTIGPSPYSSVSTGIAGSLQYAAPEVLKASGPLFEPTADIWAFGVTCYALITCELPFTHGLEQKIVSMILEGNWDVDKVKAAIWEPEDGNDEDGSLSNDEYRVLTGTDGKALSDTETDKVLELLGGCLHMDTSKRWSIRDVLECRFLEGGEEAFGIDASASGAF